MKVFSLARQGVEFVQVEVEVTLVPGLPVMHIMGLPDAATRESGPRIKAALQNQGFVWPRAKQILVNLHPSHVRKSSRGFDLAIAAALVFEMGQAQPAERNSLYYGEIDLNGQVEPPDDLFQIPQPWVENRLVTGCSKASLSYSHWRLSSLSDLKAPFLVEPGVATTVALERPAPLSLEFSKQASELLAILAAGEHSAMLAGPAGSGKSTFVDALFSLLGPPDPTLFAEAQGWAQLMGRKLVWRPYVAPHHSTPPLTMLGGGAPPQPGEVTRAHSGMLFLDEFLQFHPRVQQALREPMERGEICISRREHARTFPARFMCVAATNLCPCGKLVPRMATRCQFSLGRCKSNLEQLNGPMLDRFDILAFSHQWRGQRLVPVDLIGQRVASATSFRLGRGQTKPNRELTLRELEPQIRPWVKDHLLGDEGVSDRRGRALLRVARTVADLAGSEGIEADHLEQALALTSSPFLDLEQIFA